MLVDLHTHILPGMDDGARSAEISIELLRREAGQGVGTVVLTPHCYRNRESIGSFLKRRAESYERLQEALAHNPIRNMELRLSAEVAWMPNMADWQELQELCIEGTHNLLVELPFTTWQGQMIDQLYDMMSRGSVTPVFAHLERYVKMQRADLIEEIIRMGTPIQLSSAPLQHFWSRQPILKILKQRQDCLLASDCHNLDQRPPNLQEGLRWIERHMGREIAKQLNQTACSLLKE